MIRTTILLTGVIVLVLVLRGVAAFPTYAVVAWAAMSVLIGLAGWQWAGESRTRALGRPSRAGAVFAVASFAVGVLAAETLELSGLVTGSGILVTLAPAGWWAGKRASSGRTRGAGRQVSVRSTVPGLDDAELCLVWRRSHEELQRTPAGGPALRQLAEVRQLLLDELEKRDPAGFRRWLGSGALTGEDPRPFLRGRRPEAPADGDFRPQTGRTPRS